MLTQHDEDLFSVDHEFGWQAGLVTIPVRMTVIRLPDARLVLHSPIPLDATLRAEIDALGAVAFLVVPEMHGRFAEAAHRAYPSASLLAAPQAPRKRRSLPFDASLEDDPPAEWAGVIETHRVQGFRLGEVLLFHRPSKTLILTDLCFHIRRSSSRAARLFFRANGMWQRFGPSRIIRGVGVSDRAALRRSLEHVARWEFDRILPGHGDPIEDPPRDILREAWSL